MDGALAVAPEEIDALMRQRARALAPGAAWGIVTRGGLAHSGGCGVARLGGAAPGPDTRFRIASVTKSFTAAAVVLLRDRGLLRLDDPVTTHVPEWTTPPRPAGPPITLRQLLTMSAGFAGDDPWADRQESMAAADFTDLLNAGVCASRPAGIAYEYSNLGYAILGRVVSNVAGKEYRQFVTDEILRPLGMNGSTYDATALGAADAIGYRRDGECWTALPMSGPGAFSAIGGLVSSVAELARWIRFHTDAWTDGADETVLPAASRRDMHQAHRAISTSVLGGSPLPVPAVIARGYGYGLEVQDDLRFGRIVRHSGGYPGFSSHVAWHQASGLGVITLMNATYAGAGGPASEVMDLLLRDMRPQVITPWPETLDAKATLTGLLRSFDASAAAPQLLAANLEMDASWEARRTVIEEAVGTVGPVGEEVPGSVRSRSGAAVQWSLTGAAGRLDVGITMTPTVPPMVQSLTVAAVSTPAAELLARAREVVRWLAGTARAPAPAGLDRTDEVRLIRLHSSGIRLGRVLRCSGPQAAVIAIDQRDRTVAELDLAVDATIDGPGRIRCALRRMTLSTADLPVVVTGVNRP